jgi:hypothetical protein
MTVEEVMQYRRARPFRPFVLQLTDGREFMVREPEFIGRDVAFTHVNVDAGDESIATVDAKLIAGVRVVDASTASNPLGTGNE